MKTINRDHEKRLSHDKLVSLLNYDEVTGVFTNKVTRGPRAVAGDLSGTVDQKGYVIIKIDRVPYKAHRLAWFYIHKEWPESIIDHKNDNKLDNSIDNLRSVTNQVNVNKVKLRKSNTSGYRGVWLEAGRWAAQFRYLGEHFYLGAYNTPELASKAYEDFRKEHDII
jgi:hypothetical protein